MVFLKHHRTNTFWTCQKTSRLAEVAISFGKCGLSGRTLIKKGFRNEKEAESFIQKQRALKMRMGYRTSRRPSTWKAPLPSPRSSPRSKAKKRKAPAKHEKQPTKKKAQTNPHKKNKQNSPKKSSNNHCSVVDSIKQTPPKKPSTKDWTVVNGRKQKESKQISHNAAQAETSALNPNATTKEEFKWYHSCHSDDDDDRSIGGMVLYSEFGDENSRDIEELFQKFMENRRASTLSKRIVRCELTNQTFVVDLASMTVTNMRTSKQGPARRFPVAGVPSPHAGVPLLSRGFGSSVYYNK